MSKEIDLGTLHGVKLPAEMEWDDGDDWTKVEVLAECSDGFYLYRNINDKSFFNALGSRFRPIKEKKKVPFDQDDFIRLGHPALILKESDNSVMPSFYASDIAIWADNHTTRYEELAEECTLLDGSELYKEVGK